MNDSSEERADIGRGSYTVIEIAGRNNCSRQMIYNEIAAGELETVKIGRLRRITPEAEQKWLMKNSAAVPEHAA